MKTRFTRIHLSIAVLLLIAALLSPSSHADTHFLEAEAFHSPSEGWVPATNGQVRKASRATTLSGSRGAGDAVATTTVSIGEPGPYRVWVRAIQVARWRGPFVVSVGTGGSVIGAHVFDEEVDPDIKDWDFGWHAFEVELPAGEVTVTLAKHEQKNCSGYVRQVDCLLITSDLALVPDHVPFGPQTFLRVTVDERILEPVYLHLFADHYRDTWYSHHALGSMGLEDGTAVPRADLLAPGAASPWANIAHTVYQDSGVALNVSLRHTYASKAARLQAKLEFGRADNATATIEPVKSFEIDAEPNGLVIIVPPNLDTPENIALLRRDGDFAEETGKRADAYGWPTIGKRPVQIPFLVSAHIGGYNLPVDKAVTEREEKTLDYFGFNGDRDRVLHGLWYMKNKSYCSPDVDKMHERVQLAVTKFSESGRDLQDIAYVSLMDEPSGQPAAFMAEDESYRAAFCDWLEGEGRTPADLLVADWDAVRPVAESERETYPALHYHTQRFRTIALADFMATQRTVIEAAYGRSFPTVVNFSDGPVYHANFYGQGVDYFELLNRDGQNAIWGEDWANNASTYQCAAFNVDLMRAAARKGGQPIGHYLIAHAGRTGWDTKLKATSETARGVRMWMNFSYGPAWGTHEGGPADKSHVWYNRPENWTANAEITREIGAVEDWLLTAKPAPAEVALLYASSSDIWSIENAAFGFDRMHTWLALSHGQIPVDVVSEMDVAEGYLDRFRVCYLSGPNLSRAAAAKLRDWVAQGGHLFMTADAAARDEYNRPLDTLESLLPARRADLTMHQPYQAAGRFLTGLSVQDTVDWAGESFEVLAVQQAQTPTADATVRATFADGTPAILSAPAGQGRITSAGFLPGLSYVRAALVARKEAEKASPEKADTASPTPTPSAARLERSYNPWDFPAGMREQMLSPVNERDIPVPLTCDVPLVDAVFLPCEQGALIALANYTLEPIGELTLQLHGVDGVTQVESVHHGVIPFTADGEGGIRITLPLDATDWLKVTAARIPL